MDKVVRKMLIKKARLHKLVTYNDIMNLTGLDHMIPEDRDKLSLIMEEISRFEHSKGRPMLSALVLYQGLQEIGKRFFKLAENLGYGGYITLQKQFFESMMQQRCFEYWNNEPNYRDFFNDDEEQQAEPGSNILQRTEISPVKTKESAMQEFSFTGQDTDWIALAIEKTEIGACGEELVIAYEKEILFKTGQNAMSSKVHKVRDGMGYDILSFYPDGREKFIEVKTTKAGKDSAFPITANEIAFSSQNPRQYHLYRLFNFSIDRSPIEFFEVRGDLSTYFEFDGVVYKARRK